MNQFLRNNLSGSQKSANVLQLAGLPRPKKWLATREKAQRPSTSEIWMHQGRYRPGCPSVTKLWQGGTEITHWGSTSGQRGDVSLRGRWYWDSSARACQGDSSWGSVTYKVIPQKIEGISQITGRKVTGFLQLKNSVRRWRRWGRMT